MDTDDGHSGEGGGKGFHFDKKDDHICYYANQLATVSLLSSLLWGGGLFILFIYLFYLFWVTKSSQAFKKYKAAKAEEQKDENK